jgi:hypothetical protein
MTKIRSKKLRRLFVWGASIEGWLPALVLAWALAGCATHQSNIEEPRPGAGIAEYQQLTQEALAALRVALDSLDKLAIQPNPCPPKVITAFSGEVQRLQIDSLRIRSRAQAIQTRGDAYFADWSENIVRIKDPQIREAARRHHSELEQSFSKIKASSQQAGSNFKPFLHGLRMLHVRLETASGLAHDDPTQELIRTTRTNGAEVVRQLGIVQNELDTVSTILRTK